MAALAGARRRQRAAAPRTAFRVGRTTRWVVLVLTGLYFLVPIVASGRYAFEGNGGAFSLASLGLVARDTALWDGVVTSLEISAGTALITLLLLVPTSIWINLRLPSWRRTMENLTLLPLVVPAVVLVLGILTSFRNLPGLLLGTPVILALEYVVLALPYTYRAIDSGVRAIDLHTLVEASRSLGAGWVQCFRLVLLPNLRGSIFAAAFLSVGFCLGEFAIANLLTFNTFPTRLYEVGTEYATEAVTVSVLGLVVTWAVLLGISALGGRGPRRRGAAGLPLLSDPAASGEARAAAVADAGTGSS